MLYDDMLVMRETQLQTNSAKFYFCCNNSRINNPNSELCNYPTCNAGCTEAVGCNCPFNTNQIINSGNQLLPSLNTTCTCQPYYYGTMCGQANCTNNNCSPDGFCTDNGGFGFSCSCYQGYQGDGFNCTDRNECLVDGICGFNSTCNNTMGNYTCSCAEWFFGVWPNCVETNECELADPPCNIHASCNDGLGYYNCSCNAGYTGDGFECDEINCDSNDCDSNAFCTDNNPGYTCTCSQGYVGNGTYCNEVDCNNTGLCYPGANCMRTSDTNFECGSCPYGFNGTAIGPDGCTQLALMCDNTTLCYPGTNCTGNFTHFECGPCPPGYYGNATGIDGCIEINMCDQNTSLCYPGVGCTGNSTHFECGNCPEGFEGNAIGPDGCIESNMCDIPSLCYPEVNCTGNSTHFECGPCPSGLGGNAVGANGCVEPGNMCFNSSSLCYHGVNCTGNATYFECGPCPTGYIGNATGSDGCIEEPRNMCDNSSLCYPNVTCTGNTTYFECGPCPFGYVGKANGPNGCVRIAGSCSINNGGCDLHTTCTMVNGNNIVCSTCPEGFYGSGYTTCYPNCTNNVCEPHLGEDCVSCPYDCSNSSTSTCGVCGDGQCDPDETCDNCLSDCSVNCIPECPPCQHGSCVYGLCVCSSSWTGPSCDVQIEPVNMTINYTNPIVVIVPSPSDNLDPYIQFDISIKSIAEKDTNGMVIASVDLIGLDYSFAIINITNTSNVIYKYTATLFNKAVVNIMFIEFKDAESQYVFNNETMVFSGNTLKVEFSIASWPFKSIKNELEVKMTNEAENKLHSHCQVDTQVQEDHGQLVWLKSSLNGVSLYAQFTPESVVDGRKRKISFEYVDASTVAAVLPHFWVDAEFDPRYSVLADPDYEKDRSKVDECGNPIKGESSNIGMIAGITAGVVVGAALIAASGIYVSSRKRRNKLMTRLSMANKNKGTEMKNVKPSSESPLYANTEKENPMYTN